MTFCSLYNARFKKLWLHVWVSLFNCYVIAHFIFLALEAHLALREGTSCAKSKLCNRYLEWQLWFSLNALHTHFILLTSKFFLKTIHTAYFGARVYRDMCHRNQVNSLEINSHKINFPRDQLKFSQDQLVPFKSNQQVSDNCIKSVTNVHIQSL